MHNLTISISAINTWSIKKSYHLSSMTTIVLVRKNNEVVVAGDGQVSMGNTVV